MATVELPIPTINEKDVTDVQETAEVFLHDYNVCKNCSATPR
uniref:Uncharacterized protein n=1 Tax=viral metagenome TaxID=1070528 RepID=A0A6C0E9I8_9ZZZZ